MVSTVLTPIVNLISSVVSSVTSFIEYVTSALSSLYSLPAVFPSIWALTPSSVTSVYLGILVVVTFVGILRLFLSK